MDTGIRLGIAAINLLVSLLVGLTASTALWIFIYKQSWKRVTMLCSLFGCFFALVCFALIEFGTGG